MAFSFQYEPLVQNQIRLLQLTSCSPEIRGVLTPITMSSNPSYTALSYTWGSEQHLQHLFVGDSILLITENLATALRHLSDHVGKYLWIDAVCINQKDDAEKTEQLRKMAEIYERANMVLSWLGEESEGSNRAMEGIERYGGAAFEAGILSLPVEVRKKRPDVGENSGFQHVKRRIFELFTAAADADNNDSPDAFPRSEFSELSRRSYFDRLWIKQEVALGKQVRMACGEKVTSFEHLASAYMFFATFTVWEITERLHGRLTGFPKHFAPVLGDSGIESRNLPMPSVAIGSLLSIRRKIHQEKKRPELFWLLKRLHVGDQGQRNNCKDPRDKIYGLLGMVEGNGSHVETLIHHRQPVELLYERVARILIQQGIIDTLLFCRPRSSLELPSWVPHWNTPVPHPWSSDGIYQASGRKKQTLDRNPGVMQTGIIALEGTLVG